MGADHVKILAFGMIAEITGAEVLHTEGMKDSQDVREWLERRFPALKDKKYAMAVNRKLIHKVTVVGPDDEIALLPPFSGG